MLGHSNVVVTEHYLNGLDSEDTFKINYSILWSSEDFEHTRTMLVKEIHSKLTEEDRLFLMSFKKEFLIGSC